MTMMRHGMDALQRIRDLAEQDPLFRSELAATHSVRDAAALAARHGVKVSERTLWLNRGRVLSGGLPTWRG